MTERELRQKTVNAATADIGAMQGDARHKRIIDEYNAYSPKNRPYNMTYTDAWCAAAVSVWAVRAGVDGILPHECSCWYQMELFKAHGLSRWEEDESRPPLIGDVAYYDWNDAGDYAVTDNRGVPGHVGLVTEVRGDSFLVIEGNYSKSVKIREVRTNGRYLRGFGKPNYAALASLDPPLPGDEPSRWAVEATEWARGQGVFRGDGMGRYDWRRPVTREELAQVLYNMRG